MARRCDKHAEIILWQWSHCFIDWLCAGIQLSGACARSVGSGGILQTSYGKSLRACRTTRGTRRMEGAECHFQNISFRATG